MSPPPRPSESPCCSLQPALAPGPRSPSGRPPSALQRRPSEMPVSSLACLAPWGLPVACMHGIEGRCARPGKYTEAELERKRFISRPFCET